MLDNAMKRIAIIWRDLAYLKTLALEDTDWFVRTAAIEQLAQQFKDDSETLEILKTRALEDKSELVRRTAIQQLARQFKDDSELKAILQDRLNNDPDEKVREYVKSVMDKF